MRVDVIWLALPVAAALAVRPMACHQPSSGFEVQNTADSASPATSRSAAPPSNFRRRGAGLSNIHSPTATATASTGARPPDHSMPAQVMTPAAHQKMRPAR